MGTTASTIETGIKAQIVTELGASYVELPFTHDVSKNKFRGGTTGYAVIPGRIDETDGVNGYVTVDQEFGIILTESYVSAQTNDLSQRVAARTLIGRLEDVYERLIRQKAGAAAQVMRVSGLSAAPVEFIDANVAVLRATISIKYRTAL